LFWRFHSGLCSKSCSLICHLRGFLLHGAACKWASSTECTIQTFSTAFNGLVWQVAGQFPFPLPSQKSCFFLRKTRTIKSQTSPESTGWDPGASSPSSARFHKFKLLYIFCSHLFSVPGNRVGHLQEQPWVCYCLAVKVPPAGHHAFEPPEPGTGTPGSRSGQQLLGSFFSAYPLKENN